MKAKGKDDESKRFRFGKGLTFAAVVVIVVILVLVGFLFMSYPSQPSQLKAAIIDQLGSSQLASSSRHTNETFINAARALLSTRFTQVDYYSDNATVDQYRLLPSKSYRLIVWRAHSALNVNSKYLVIGTSERNTSANYERYVESGYFDEDELNLFNVTDDPNWYIAITPNFINNVMLGGFEDTVIILMSCNGLAVGYYSTANALMAKGAKVVISWNGWIDPVVNDNAMNRLLEYLISGNNTISQAVGKIPPYYSELYGLSELDYQPSEMGGYQIPDYRESVKIADAAFFVTCVPTRKMDWALF